MLIALLLVLGVDLIVVVMIVAIELGRKRWLKRQPGEFAGAIRVADGDLDGLSSKWRHGSGRWVRDVLVWNKAPFMFRTELIPVDHFAGMRPASSGQIKRLGDTPVVLEFTSSAVTVEVAGRAELRALVAGPFSSLASPDDKS